MRTTVKIAATSALILFFTGIIPIEAQVSKKPAKTQKQVLPLPAPHPALTDHDYKLIHARMGLTREQVDERIASGKQSKKSFLAWIKVTGLTQEGIKEMIRTRELYFQFELVENQNAALQEAEKEKCLYAATFFGKDSDRVQWTDFGLATHLTFDKNIPWAVDAYESISHWRHDSNHVGIEQTLLTTPDQRKTSKAKGAQFARKDIAAKRNMRVGDERSDAGATALGLRRSNVEGGKRWSDRQAELMEAFKEGYENTFRTEIKKRIGEPAAAATVKGWLALALSNGGGEDISINGVGADDDDWDIVYSKEHRNFAYSQSVYYGFKKAKQRGRISGSIVVLSQYELPVGFTDLETF